MPLSADIKVFALFLAWLCFASRKLCAKQMASRRKSLAGESEHESNVRTCVRDSCPSVFSVRPRFCPCGPVSIGARAFRLNVCVCVCNKISSKEIHLKRKLSRRKWHFLGMSRRRHFGCFFAPAGLTLIITCIFGAK